MLRPALYALSLGVVCSLVLSAPRIVEANHCYRMKNQSQIDNCLKWEARGQNARENWERDKKNLGEWGGRMKEWGQGAGSGFLQGWKKKDR